MKFKKFAAVALAAALAVSALAGCGSKDNGGSTAAPAATGSAVEEAAGTVEEQLENSGIPTKNTETGNTTKSDETLVVELGSYPDFFWHPGLEGQSGANEEQIINAAFLDRLVELDETTGEVIPSLAESWEIDGKDFTFHLRQGVKMTDGSELTADDVVYSVNVFMTNCASNDTGKYFTGVTKVDDYTVTLSFNAAAPDILKMLTWANFGIVSEDEINALGGLEAAAQNPVMGCGKYKFKEAKSGEYVILERNEEYWDPNYAGYFKEIKFIVVNDSNSKVSSVLSGDADVAYDMPVAQAATFVGNPDLRTYIYPGGENMHLWFNMGEGHATSDINVRKAIDKLIDYDAVTMVATAGYGEVSRSYTSTTSTYYVEGWTAEEMAVDIEGAKALLEEAGYNESNPLQLVTVTLADLVDVYTVIQANLAAAGVNLEIQTMDMGGFVPAMLFDKSYDIILVGDDTTMRAPYITQFVAEGMVFGGPNMVLPEHEEILTRLMEAATDDDAKTILAEYQEKVKEDMVCTNSHQNMKSSIVGKDIKGYATRERGYVDVTTLFK